MNAQEHYDKAVELLKQVNRDRKSIYATPDYLQTTISEADAHLRAADLWLRLNPPQVTVTPPSVANFPNELLD